VRSELGLEYEYEYGTGTGTGTRTRTGTGTRTRTGTGTGGGSGGGGGGSGSGSAAAVAYDVVYYSPEGKRLYHKPDSKTMMIRRYLDQSGKGAQGMTEEMFNFRWQHHIGECYGDMDIGMPIASSESDTYNAVVQSQSHAELDTDQNGGSGRWKDHEHQKFLQGLAIHGPSEWTKVFF
jgi:hypothetical protein